MGFRCNLVRLLPELFAPVEDAIAHLSPRQAPHDEILPPDLAQVSRLCSGESPMHPNGCDGPVSMPPTPISSNHLACSQYLIDTPLLQALRLHPCATASSSSSVLHIIDVPMYSSFVVARGGLVGGVRLHEARMADLTRALHQSLMASSEPHLVIMPYWHLEAAFSPKLMSLMCKHNSTMAIATMDSQFPDAVRRYSACFHRTITLPYRAYHLAERSAWVDAAMFREGLMFHGAATNGAGKPRGERALLASLVAEPALYGVPCSIRLDSTVGMATPRWRAESRDQAPPPLPLHDPLESRDQAPPPLPLRDPLPSLVPTAAAPHSSRSSSQPSHNPSDSPGSETLMAISPPPPPPPPPSRPAAVTAELPVWWTASCVDGHQVREGSLQEIVALLIHIRTGADCRVVSSKPRKPPGSMRAYARALTTPTPAPTPTPTWAPPPPPANAPPWPSLPRAPVWSVNTELHQSFYAMRAALLCFVPEGDTISSRRLFDALAAGCVPVVLRSRSERYVRDLPFPTSVPWAAEMLRGHSEGRRRSKLAYFATWPPTSINSTANWLRSLLADEDTLRRMREEGQKAFRAHMSYERHAIGVADGLLTELATSAS